MFITKRWLVSVDAIAVFIGLLLKFIVFMFWFLPILWRGIKLVLGNVSKVTRA